MGMGSPCSGRGEADQSLLGKWLHWPWGSLPSLLGLWVQHSTQGRRQLSRLSRAHISGRGAARLALGVHTLSAADSPVFPVFNKVHCRKANAEAPGIGAQQLILQTSCPAISGVSQTPTASTAAEDGTRSMWKTPR